ncbi:MAG: hypothetical protein LBT08_09550, partial [Synergistaceae bacterium]|nr:hypothetical protein [Synergistaceae bacterium]
MSSMSRLLKYVLVVSLALFAPPAWALDTWDGSSGVLTDLNQISGTMGVDAVYEISTAHGLEYVAQQVNSGTTYSGETIRLTDDLNMNGFSWNFSTPIGDRSLSYAFEGTFDGNGHTISNLWMGLPSGDGVGLFGFIDDAVITNLILTGVNVAG